MPRTPRPPTSLRQFKARPMRVTVTKHPKDLADVEATKILLELHTQEDGFHCPRCGEVIPDREKAVIHLAEEMNKALAKLFKLAGP